MRTKTEQRFMGEFKVITRLVLVFTAMAATMLSRHSESSENQLTFGDWIIFINIDPFSDEDKSLALPLGGRNRAKASSEAVVIGFTCRADVLSVTLSHKHMTGGLGGKVVVQIRVDDNPPYGPNDWILFSNSILSFPQTITKDIKAIIRQMLAGSTVIVRITDPSAEEVLTTRWSLNGFSEAVKHLVCYSVTALE